ncbi:hypothetical protein C8K18_12923 [Paraburkholderia sp. GV068]|nr:hypothetical protein C8K19_13115 [Paraburkholderia sp. GV072]PUA93719.1 hypothetical protein C8K18_12923 [Paraburkholderia sp. GV068]
MRSQLKPASASIGSDSEYAVERRTRAHILDAADALRAEKRRVSYAAIDSNASKWRCSVLRAKS